MPQKYSDVNSQSHQKTVLYCYLQLCMCHKVWRKIGVGLTAHKYFHFTQKFISHGRQILKQAGGKIFSFMKFCCISFYIFRCDRFHDFYGNYMENMPCIIMMMYLYFYLYLYLHSCLSSESRVTRSAVSPPLPHVLTTHNLFDSYSSQLAFQSRHSASTLSTHGSHSQLQSVGCSFELASEASRLASLFLFLRFAPPWFPPPKIIVPHPFPKLI